MVAIDQTRTVDKVRLIRKAGKAPPQVTEAVKSVIREMLID